MFNMSIRWRKEDYTLKAQYSNIDGNVYVTIERRVDRMRINYVCIGSNVSVHSYSNAYVDYTVVEHFREYIQKRLPMIMEHMK